MDTATPETGTESSVEDVAGIFEDMLGHEETPQDAKKEEPKEEEEGTQEEPESEPEGESEPESEPEGEESEEQEPEAEELELSTLAELAEHFELDPESLDGLKVKIKVGGEEQEVTLAEARNGYQREADYSRKTNEVAKQREEVSQEKQALEAERAQHIQSIDELGWIIRQQIEGDNFEELRDPDPAEYSARMEDRRQRVEQFQQMGQQRALLAEQQAAENEQRSLALRGEEESKLLSAFPDWADQATRRTGSNQISSYLVNEGFTEHEVKSVIDHRLIKMADKARQFDEMKSQVSVVKKKVIRTPKLQKSGSPKSSKEAKMDKGAALRNRQKTSGSIEDTAAVFLNMLE